MSDEKPLNKPLEYEGGDDILAGKFSDIPFESPVSPARLGRDDVVQFDCHHCDLMDDSYSFAFLATIIEDLAIEGFDLEPVRLNWYEFARITSNAAQSHRGWQVVPDGLAYITMASHPHHSRIGGLADCRR